MLNVKNIFSNEEFDMMNYWIDRYAGTSNSSSYDRVSVQEILSKPGAWADSKEFLYNAFGQKTIISKEIEFSRSTEQLAEVFYDALQNHEHVMYPFFRTVCDKRNSYSWFSPEYNLWSDICSLLDTWDLATNVYLGRTFKFSPLDSPEKTITISSGMSVIKALGKIAAAFNIPGFEAFRIAHSQILNQAKIKGELCLSIHPMDYMTMSDNDNDWESCMSWINNGCYRRGTVEMMNSPLVVVAYVTSSSPMCFRDFEWNNKKWRTLIVVDPETIITTVKSYPYQNDELSQVAVTWIAELSNQNCNTSFDISTLAKAPYNGEFKTMARETLYPIVMNTNDMYNDFGAVDYHTCLITAEYAAIKDKTPKRINYSGQRQCMWCGETSVDFGAEEYLVCYDCGDYHEGYCPWCDCNVDEDELREVDGQLLCENCYEENTAWDVITNERHLIDNMTSIYLLSDEPWQDDISWRYTYACVLPSTLELTKMFPYEVKDDYYIARISSLTEEQLKMFDLFSTKEIQEYVEYIKS